MFDAQFIERLCTGKYARAFAPEDLIATAAVFTTASISFNIREHVDSVVRLHEIIVSGGVRQ